MASKPLPGYAREKGAARGYIGPGGERLSRRQYDKIAHAARGKAEKARENPSWYARVLRGVRQFWRRLGRYTDKRRAEGADVERREARKEPAFREARASLAALKGRTGREQRLRTAGKKREANAYGAETRAMTRDALEAMGLRDGVPHWVPPGASEKGKRGEITRVAVQRSPRKRLAW